MLFKSLFSVQTTAAMCVCSLQAQAGDVMTTHICHVISIPTFTFPNRRKSKQQYFLLLFLFFPLGDLVYTG